MGHKRRLNHFCLGLAILCGNPNCLQTIAGQNDSTHSAHHTSIHAALFDHDVLSDNIDFVLRQARSMPPLEAYQFLKRHVFPDRNRLRLRLAFTTTSPVEPMADQHSDDAAIIEAGKALGQRRIRTGGRLVSPALDLVDAAKAANTLPELKALVLAIEPENEITLRSRLSLLAMINLASNDLDVAVTSVDELYRRFLAERLPTLEGRTPETLLLDRCVKSGLLLDESLLFLTSIVDSQIRTSKNSGPDSWNSFIVNLWGRARLLKRHGTDSGLNWSQAPELKQWHWVTRSHSWSNGHGLSSGHILADSSGAEFFGKQDDEYLLFTSPLRGEYTLECDCTCFGWKEIHPFVGGMWMTPVWHHETLQIGEFFRHDRDEKLVPRLSAVNDKVLFRVDVRDGVVSRYINSRLLMRQPLPENFDPWLVIRNMNSGAGRVENVRIYGDPVVPDEVVISEVRSSNWSRAVPTQDVKDPAADRSINDLVSANASIKNIHGWFSWHEDPWTPDKSTWKLAEFGNSSVQIVGTRRQDVPGVGLERLLRYQWPLVWDSDVSYDFYYEAGSREVHPVIGRHAMLVSPDGVQTHWVTNGYHDSTDLDPLAKSPLLNRLVSQQVSLKNKSWNHAVLSLRGDTVRLKINDVPVFESDVAITNDRSFGFFYYCDQSEARVRNVVLKGDWPKAVPEVIRQELKGASSEAEDEQRITLPESYELDFTAIKPEELLTQIVPYGTAANSKLALTSDGYQSDGYQLSTKDAINSFRNPGIIILATLDGDFDAIVEFADLKLKVPSNGVASIRMIVQLLEADANAPQPPPIENYTTEGHSIVPAFRRYVNYQLFHGVVQHPDTPIRRISQVEIDAFTDGKQSTSYRRIIADDCDFGRLRMIRKGNQLSYWIAPLDSPYFRLLYTGELPENTLSRSRIFLNNFCYSSNNEPASVAVNWRKVSVRANRIERAPMVSQPLSVKKKPE